MQAQTSSAIISEQMKTGGRPLEATCSSPLTYPFAYRSTESANA